MNRGDAVRLPEQNASRMHAVLTTRPDYDPKESFQSALFEETTWMNPLDFESLVRFLVPEPVSAPVTAKDPKARLKR